MDFLTQYWPLILIAVSILIKILNKTTQHFSEHEGLVKWLLYVVDLLDILKSTPSRKALLLLAFMPLIGCATWKATAITEGKKLRTCVADCVVQCGIEQVSDAVCRVKRDAGSDE